MKAEHVLEVDRWIETQQDILRENPQPRATLRQRAEDDLGFRVSDGCMVAVLQRHHLPISLRASQQLQLEAMRTRVRAFQQRQDELLHVTRMLLEMAEPAAFKDAMIYASERGLDRLIDYDAWLAREEASIAEPIAEPVETTP